MEVLTPFTIFIINLKESLNSMMYDFQVLLQILSSNFTDANFFVSVYGLEYCCYCLHHEVNELGLSVIIHP